ncbi:MAG: hypothetical protein IT230_14165 [Flavobacteriales bacterium]|nr:hypothetical protein [Flavobacteriales bacterium]
MRATYLLLASFLAPALAYGQSGQGYTGARMAGMGLAGTTLVDLWSVNHNQAGLAGLDKPVAGAYFQQHWLVPDLAMQGLAVALPVGKGTFAFSGNAFGNSLYAQRSFGLAYAMKLNEGLHVGVQLDYLNIQLGEGYGSTGALTAELGVQARLTDALWIGAHLYNPNRAELGGPYAEKAPTILAAGLGYRFNEQVVLTGEVTKDIDRPEQFHAGVEYRPVSTLFLRTGISSGPSMVHFGAGVQWKRLDLDLATVIRAQLGLTPMLNLNYRFP